MALLDTMVTISDVLIRQAWRRGDYRGVAPSGTEWQVSRIGGVALTRSTTYGDALRDARMLIAHRGGRVYRQDLGKEPVAINLPAEASRPGTGNPQA